MHLRHLKGPNVNAQPSLADIHDGTNECGPDYKDQCRPSSYRTASSSTQATTPSSEAAIRHFEGPRNCSADRSCHIPIVCGVLLPDDIDAAEDEGCQVARSVPCTIQFEALQQRQRDETAPSEIDARSERAPSTSHSSSSRKSSGSSRSSLSQQEKRYWIRVIACAVIVNTLLVSGIVVGGVCATGGCHVNTSCRSPTDISSGNKTDSSVEGSSTDAPTPSPSHRRTSSFAPTTLFPPPRPTLLNESLPPTAFSGEVGGAADPEFGPSQDSLVLSPSLSPMSISPSVNFSKPEDLSSQEDNTNAKRFPFLLFIPVSVLLDLLLVFCYLFCHYKRWIKVRNALGDGSMTRSDEMNSFTSDGSKQEML